MSEILRAPSEGVPPLLDDETVVNEAITALASGTGPIAVDTERANGFRYTNKAYLLQFRREGSGTKLIDPVYSGQTPPSFAQLSEAIPDDWIIHAASQDLPALVEIGLTPNSVFDTELAGRLLGFDKVNLSSMLERHFDIQLLKEHSAVDWSTRPLPQDWLNYAALDVELLIELRAALIDELHEADKYDWAIEEFAYVLTKNLEPVRPKTDPWRHTSGIHQVKNRLGLAIVREIWFARDEIAAELDRAPGKIVQDSAISELATLAKDGSVPTKAQLYSAPGFVRRNARRYERDWVDALARVRQLSEAEFPPCRVENGQIPHQRTWARANPVAAKRWETVRPAVVEKAEELQLPVENLISPDPLRALLWENPTDIEVFLIEHEVRHWQRVQLLPLLTDFLAS